MVYIYLNDDNTNELDSVHDHADNKHDKIEEISNKLKLIIYSINNQ